MAVQSFSPWDELSIMKRAKRIFFLIKKKRFLEEFKLENLARPGYTIQQHQQKKIPRK